MRVNHPSLSLASMDDRPRLLLPAVAGLLVAGAVAFAILAGSAGKTGGGSRPSTAPAPGFDGAALPAGVRAPAFTLTDQDGRRISLSSARGRPVLIAFPYTGCRDSCVLIAQQIRGALDELSRPPAVLLISADPAGDTPARIHRFLERVSLTGRASYLTGTNTQLRGIWRSYRVTPASAGPAAYAKYATVLLLDGQGDERVLYGPEQLTPEALSHDIRKIEGG
jgi:protein SCO1